MSCLEDIANCAKDHYGGEKCAFDKNEAKLATIALRAAFCQLGSRRDQGRQPIVLIFGPTIFDCDVPALGKGRPHPSREGMRLLKVPTL
jgi:hypothetical protein